MFSSPVMPLPGINFPFPDWRSSVSIEEREVARKRIASAFRKAELSKENLIEVVAALEEELVLRSCPSRLAYVHEAAGYSKKIQKTHEMLANAGKLEQPQASNGAEKRKHEAQAAAGKRRKI